MIGLVRWILFEVLPLPASTRGFHLVGAACRLLACAVSVAVLSLELRASATSHGEVLALLWVVSTVTALLIGNIAREVLFEVCTSVAALMGRAFFRDGVTLGGRSFLEIHHPSRTWLRCESFADEFSYEWTEPTGRCNRIDVRLRSDRVQCERGLLPVIRVTTAPRVACD